MKFNRNALLIGALAAALALFGPPSSAVDDSNGDTDNIFELGVNEDTLEDNDSIFPSGPHKDEEDPRANILGCLDPDQAGGDPAECEDLADLTSTTATPGRGPDWSDLFTGVLDNVVGRTFVVPTAKDQVGGTPGNITNGPDGTPDFENYGAVFSIFIGDDISAAGLNDQTTTVSGGSDTNEDLPETYEWGTDSVPIKDDITNLICYVRNHPTTQNLILYCGIERLNTDGDSHLDIELNKTQVGLDEDPPCDNPLGCFFEGERSENDLLVSIDFTNGGDLGSLEVRTWDETLETWGDPDISLNGEGCNPANGFDEDSVCIFNNNANINGGPWPNFVKSGTPVANDLVSNGFSNGVIPRNALSEFGIDVTELLGETPCLSSATARTRSSASFTAQLKDFAAFGFELCSIDVIKSGDTLSKIGDPVNYSFTITNTGAITLYKQSIIDTLLGDLTDGSNSAITNSTCGASLAPNASCTITATRTVLQGDADPLPNTVNVVYNNQADLLGAEVANTDSHSVNLFQPNVTVVKTGPASAEVGQQITYNFVITNNGSTDSPPLLVDSISDSILGDLLDDAPASCDSLAQGASCNFNVNFTIPDADPDPLVNTVTVHYHPTGFPNDITDTDDHSVAILTPSVLVEKTGDALSKIGDEVTYSFTITNTGDTVLNLISIVDDKLGTLTGAPSPASCDTLQIGGSCNFNVNHTIPAAATDPYNNEVTVTYDAVGATANATDTDTHSVSLFQPSVLVVKTGPSAAEVGQQITYSFTITNNGSADSPNLILDTLVDTILGDLEDDAPASCDSIAQGANCQFTVDFTIPDDDPNPLVNTVTAHYHPLGFPNDISDSDDHSVAIAVPGVEVIKDGDDLSKKGDQVTYEFTINNTGNTVLNLISISDTKLGDLAGDAPVECDTLQVGGTCDFSVNHIIPNDATDPYDNIVTVTYDAVGAVANVSDTDDHSTNLFQPGVTVVKTGTELSKVGDDANYTIVVTNTSSDDTPDLINGTIVDSLLGDLLDAGNTFVVTNNCTATLATTAGVDSCTITATRTVQAGDADPLPNTVTVHYNPEGFPNDITDSDSHSVNLFQPAINLTKTGDTLSKITDPVNYTITLQNLSSADSPDLDCTVTDATVGVDETFSVAPGDDHVINVNNFVIPGGASDPFNNTASVSCSPDGFPNILTDSDNHSINLFQPSITVAKSCTNEPVTVGDNAIFQITITNTSSTDAPDLIKDSIDDPGAPASCDVLGDAEVCQFNVSILATQADLVGGITNSVTAHYHPTGFPNDITDTDEDNCDVIPPAPGTIIIEKELRPGTGTFNYTTTGGNGLPGAFDLTPIVGGSTIGSALGPVQTPATDGFDKSSFGNIGTVFGGSTTYTVDETGLAVGTAFLSLSCTETGTANTTVAGDVATIRLEEGETVTCRFINTGVVFEGCTPGYWRNHPERWNDPSNEAVGGSASNPLCTSPLITTDKTDFTDRVKFCRNFNQVFGSGPNITLLQGTRLQGGGIFALRRHASAGLASADSGINYEFTVEQIIALYQDAVGTLAGPETISSALAKISTANQMECPLN